MYQRERLFLVDINECAESPCTNGAQCVNVDGSYVCHCPTGWTGSLCSTGVYLFYLKTAF